MVVKPNKLCMLNPFLERMMSEVVMSTTMVPLSNKMLNGSQFSSGGGKSRGRRKAKIQTVKSKMAPKEVTYSSSISTDFMIPMHESPLASLDQYLEYKPRVFKAIFPEKGKIRRLNEDHWRVKMLPIEFPMLTAWPVVDMRVTYKSGGVDYPPGVPLDITKVVELDIIRWDMQGLDMILKPSEFVIGLKGTFYPDRRGPKTRLKGQLHMSISFVLPTFLALVPENLRQGIADSILKGVMVDMKQRINRSLLADYNEFTKEKFEALA